MEFVFRKVLGSNFTNKGIHRRFSPICFEKLFRAHIAQKMKFSIKGFFSKCDQILNRKLHFLCSDTFWGMLGILRASAVLLKHTLTVACG